MFKRIIIILLWISLPVTLVVLMGFVQKEQQYMPFKSIEINIDYSDGNFFVGQNDIKSIIYRNKKYILCQWNNEFSNI